MEILDKREIKVNFENKWREEPRKFSTILFKGENTPLMMRAGSFLPRTPHFYLSPKIPGGARGLLPPPCVRYCIEVELRVLYCKCIFQDSFETYETFLRCIIVHQERKFNLSFSNYYISLLAIDENL